MIYIIKLSPEHLSVISEALGEMPLKKSMAVFNLINNQVIEQDIQAAQTEKVEEENESKRLDRVICVYGTRPC